MIENGRVLLSSVVASQIDLHAKYGGVFPEVASRQHIRTIYAVIEQALQQAHMSLADLDAIAVTRGPGLAGSLVVGMNTAKGLALASEAAADRRKSPGRAYLFGLGLSGRSSGCAGSPAAGTAVSRCWHCSFPAGIPS